MGWRHLVHVVGLLLVALSAALGATALVSLSLGEGDAWPFALTAAGSASVGLVAHRSTELGRDLTVR